MPERRKLSLFLFRNDIFFFKTSSLFEIYMVPVASCLDTFPPPLFEGSEEPSPLQTSRDSPGIGDAEDPHEEDPHRIEPIVQTVTKIIDDLHVEGRFDVTIVFPLAFRSFSDWEGFVSATNQKLISGQKAKRVFSSFLVHQDELSLAQATRLAKCSTQKKVEIEGTTILIGIATHS